MNTQSIATYLEEAAGGKVRRKVKKAIKQFRRVSTVHLQEARDRALVAKDALASAGIAFEDMMRTFEHAVAAFASSDAASSKRDYEHAEESFERAENKLNQALRGYKKALGSFAEVVEDFEEIEDATAEVADDSEVEAPAEVVRYYVIERALTREEEG